MRYKSDKDIIRELNEEDDYLISSSVFRWIMLIVVSLCIAGMIFFGYQYWKLG